MNREIKFRAFDNNEMHYRVVPIKYDEVFDPKLSVYRKVTDTMQFTGINDKNGVEIYEGDICMSTSVDGDSVDAVVFTRGCFCLDWPLLEYGSHQIEVIGNIHQHAHFLAP